MEMDILSVDTLIQDAAIPAQLKGRARDSATSAILSTAAYLNVAQ
jgi:hypothetical protein